MKSVDSEPKRLLMRSADREKKKIASERKRLTVDVKRPSPRMRKKDKSASGVKMKREPGASRRMTSAEPDLLMRKRDAENSLNRRRKSVKIESDARRKKEDAFKSKTSSNTETRSLLRRKKGVESS